MSDICIFVQGLGHQFNATKTKANLHYYYQTNKLINERCISTLILSHINFDELGGINKPKQ